MVAPVRLQFDAMEKAHEAYTGNISIGGMFVQDKNPRTVGTLARFELRLDAGEPIKGVGEVAWIRTRSLGPEAPSGMGIQFGHLEESSHDRLREAVLKALASLGIDGLLEPAPGPAVDRPSSPPSKHPSPDPTAEPQRKPSSPKPESRAKSRTAKQPIRQSRSQASRVLEKGKKKAQPTPIAMSGRTKTLIVILGLLAMLLLLLT